jgi:hypothetical protein
VQGSRLNLLIARLETRDMDESPNRSAGNSEWAGAIVTLTDATLLHQQVDEAEERRKDADDRRRDQGRSLGTIA